MNIVSPSTTEPRIIILCINSISVLSYEIFSRNSYSGRPKLNFTLQIFGLLICEKGNERRICRDHNAYLFDVFEHCLLELWQCPNVL